MLLGEAFDALVKDGGAILRYAYRLDERREEGIVHALHAFAIGASGRIQMAIYFDDPADQGLTRQMWRSLNEAAVS